MNTLTKTENGATTTSAPEVREDGRGAFPHVDIVETRDGYTLRADLPGVDKDGLEVLLENNELTLVGRRHKESVQGQYLYRETVDTEYRRTFSLDPSIDTARIKASMNHGILILELPKAEAVKPRKIAVTG